MSVRRSWGALGAFLFAATTAITFSAGARAETRPLWLDSAIAMPVAQFNHSAHWKRVHRLKEAGTPPANYVAAPSQPRPVEVVSATPVRSDCFW